MQLTKRQFLYICSVVCFGLAYFFLPNFETSNSAPSQPSPTPFQTPLPTPTPYVPYFKMEKLSKTEWVLWVEKGFDFNTTIPIAYQLEVKTGPEEHYRCQILALLTGKERDHNITLWSENSVPGYEGLIRWNNPELIANYFWPKTSYNLSVKASPEFCNQTVKIIVKGS